MRNLIRASLFRLGRDRIFRVSGVVMLVLIGGLCAVMQNNILRYEPESHGRLDYYFSTLPFFGLFLFAPATLFLGAEYGDGVLRNKLMVGHTREKLYLSSLAVSIVISAALYIVWMLAGLCGFLLHGTFAMSAGEVFGLFLLGLLSVTVWASLFTMVGVLSANKSLAVVCAVFLTLLLILAAALLSDLLLEPEMRVSSFILTPDGEEVASTVPNPDYLGGIKRFFAMEAMYLLPSGQEMLIADRAFLGLNVPRFVLHALLVIGLSTCAGIRFFRAQDLK